MSERRQFERRELTEPLIGAITRLGPAIRRTILLRIVEERRLEETAQALGISTTTGKSRLFQGRWKLRGSRESRALARTLPGTSRGSASRDAFIESA